MHISKLSSQQLWMISAAITPVFAFLFFIVFGSLTTVDILPILFFPGMLFAGFLALLFTFLFPFSDIILSLTFIVAFLVSFLVYTCIIRVILDFALKYFYEKR